MTQFDLTEDQRAIQEMAQRFTADAITPFAAEWDEKHIFPRDTIRAAAELGFGGIYVSEASGQRWVIVLTFVQNITPSMPCWLVSPKAERFQPPNVW